MVVRGAPAARGRRGAAARPAGPSASCRLGHAIGARATGAAGQRPPCPSTVGGHGAGGAAWPGRASRTTRVHRASSGEALRHGVGSRARVAASGGSVRAGAGTPPDRPRRASGTMAAGDPPRPPAPGARWPPDACAGRPWAGVSAHRPRGRSGGLQIQQVRRATWRGER